VQFLGDGDEVAELAQAQVELSRRRRLRIHVAIVLIAAAKVLDFRAVRHEALSVAGTFLAGGVRPRRDMRLVTYQRNGHARSGVVVGEDVYETGFATTRAALEAGSIEPGEHAGTLGELALGPPITDPDKIVCLGLNYRDHAAESGLALPRAPMLFAKFRNSLAGPRDAIVLPSRGELFDYEAELAIVIGRRGKDISAGDALEHVAGAMVFNDVTARDVQHATSQWTAGKAIDTFAPCGPALVTLDEIGDLQDLAIRARVNGETVQDGHAGQMIFGVAERSSSSPA
jgi:2-keto-4-pentenoate hydratase/2-oxohepta-3-ene-1,7-dioic acid hydratase in catechol pathway